MEAVALSLGCRCNIIGSRSLIVVKAASETLSVASEARLSLYTLLG